MLEDSNYRITIKDIAEELGVSTATVSNVINGKTKKISDATVERVQRMIEEKNYIPNMAAILLAQNNSRIICIAISNHDKYEGTTLQDPFVSALLDNMSVELDKNNYFMMIKLVEDINEIIKYASMWNMSGLVLIGFCSQEYDNLRRKIRIPFVVMDGFFQPEERCANIGIDDFQGGYKMGKYLVKMGHRNIMYISDNDLCMDHNRYMGLKHFFKENSIDDSNVKLELIPMRKEERINHYKILEKKLSNFTAIFCASDTYAIEVMNYLQDKGYKVPLDISIVGFDDIPACQLVRPALTTIKQDIKMRAETAMNLLNEQIKGDVKRNNVILSVELVERDSVSCLVK